MKKKLKDILIIMMAVAIGAGAESLLSTDVGVILIKGVEELKVDIKELKGKIEELKGEIEKLKREIIWQKEKEKEESEKRIRNAYNLWLTVKEKIGTLPTDKEGNVIGDEELTAQQVWNNFKNMEEYKILSQKESDKLHRRLEATGKIKFTKPQQSQPKIRDPLGILTEPQQSQPKQRPLPKF